MAVGRLPFRNAAEAVAMVTKIVGYSQSRASEEVLLVADLNEGFNFEQASAQLVGTIPPDLRANQINRGQVGTATAKAQMLAAITRGPKVVNYAGHGSVNQWRDNIKSSWARTVLLRGALPLTSNIHVRLDALLSPLRLYSSRQLLVTNNSDCLCLKLLIPLPSHARLAI